MAHIDSSSNTTVVYTPTEEDIQMVLKQVIVDPSIARDLLIKHNGDVLAAVLDAFNIDKAKVESVNTKKYNIDDETQSVNQKLCAFRNILDEKDSVFQKNIAKEIDTSGAREFEYVLFDHSTTVYTRQRATNTKQVFIDEIVRGLLEGESITDTKVTQKYLGDDSKRLLASKWGFYQAGILYITSDTTNQLPVNQLATTLLHKSNNIDESVEFRGKCIIVNHWF